MSDASGAIRFALAQRGKDYVYGAEGPDTFDCSGLMVRAFQKVGITLPRTTQAMLADSHLKVVTKAQLLPGDLVFPSTEHVQMYLGGGKVVEAPRTGLKVRVAPLGTVYAARRVTEPASGSYGDASSGSPVTGTTPVTGTAIQSSVSEMFGSGLTNAFTAILKPLLSFAWWAGEITIGVSLLVGGIYFISFIGLKEAGVLS